MKALIYILAIVLMAAGIAAGLLSFFSPGQVVLGLDLGLGATLLTGGVVTLALAGVMTSIAGLRRQLGRLGSGMAAAGGYGAAGEAAIREEDGLAGAEGAGGGAAAAAAAAEEETPAADAETADAQAESEAAEERAQVRRDIFVSPREAESEAEPAADEEAAAEEAEAVEAPAEAAEAEEGPVAEAVEEAGEEAAAAEEAVEEAAEEAAEEMDVDGLYVVEERIIRSRPARLLSDGTVEAETDEGWMRFENLEHLEEYLEAMSHAR